MALAALGAQGLGVGMGAAGSYFAAKSAKQSAKFEAQMMRINAQLAESDARASLARGEKAEQVSRMGTAQLKSSQRVAMAGNGIDLGSDTAVDVLTTTDVLGETDANTIKANALREAWGHRLEATSHRSGARMAEASAAGMNPWMAAGTSLLTGASQVHSSYTGFKESGALYKSEKAWTKRAGGFLDGLKGL